MQVLPGEIGRADWTALCGLATEEMAGLLAAAEKEVGVGQSAADKAVALVGAVQALVAGVTMFKRLEAEVDLATNEVLPNKLTGLLKKQLDLQGISVQRYWANTLVGPDCRKFLKNFRAILEGIKGDMMAAGHLVGECDDFVKKTLSSSQTTRHGSPPDEGDADAEQRDRDAAAERGMHAVRSGMERKLLRAE